MKKKKISLDVLQVNSFVTSISGKAKVTLKGGDQDSADGECTGGGVTAGINCWGGSNPPDCFVPPRTGGNPCGGNTPSGTCPVPTDLCQTNFSCGNCPTGFGCFPGDTY